MDYHIGQIILTSNSDFPHGSKNWLECNGQFIGDKPEYANLSNAINSGYIPDIFLPREDWGFNMKLFIYAGKVDAEIARYNRNMGNSQ